MTIIQIAEQFPDENSCKVDFKQKRDKEGIICKKCECTKHYWLQDKWQWQCKPPAEPGGTHDCLEQLYCKTPGG